MSYDRTLLREFITPFVIDISHLSVRVKTKFLQENNLMFPQDNRNQRFIGYLEFPIGIKELPIRNLNSNTI